MLYLFSDRSQSSLQLLSTLGARRLKQFDGLDFWERGQRVPLASGDVIICWGRSCPEMDGIRVLNSFEPKNKFEMYSALSASGLPSTSATDSRDAALMYNKQYGYNFIPRTFGAVGGADLITPPVVGDYWVMQLKGVEKEFRLQCFGQKVLRTAEKVRTTPFAHDWVKSEVGGWAPDYAIGASNVAMRKLARVAIKTLGLTFGEVDIVQISTGRYAIVDVHLQPRGGEEVLAPYAKAIQAWIDFPNAPIKDDKD